MQPREKLEKKLVTQPLPSPSQHYKMNPPFSSTQVSENQIFLLYSAFATTNLPMPQVNFSFFTNYNEEILSLPQGYHE